MFRSFHGHTADEVWSAIASTFNSSRDIELRESRAGRVLDLGNVCISIKHPRQRWVISRQPAINPAFAIAEVVWIINGRNDANFLNFFNTKLHRFAGNAATYDGAYGHRLRLNLGVDQLDRAHSILQSNPETRQVVLQIWDAKRDLPLENGCPASTDVPCNIVCLLKVRSNKLHWTQVMRSNDAYLGLPHNLIQFTTLQEVLAGWLDLQCGEFNLVTDSLHLYQVDVPHVQRTVALPTVENTDNLSCDRIESETSFQLLSRCIDHFIQPDTHTSDICNSVQTTTLSLGYRNLLRVLAAEVLRRRQQYTLASGVMKGCTNPILNRAWNRWIERLHFKEIDAASHSLPDQLVVSNAQGG